MLEREKAADAATTTARDAWAKVAERRAAVAEEEAKVSAAMASVAEAEAKLETEKARVTEIGMQMQGLSESMAQKVREVVRRTAQERKIE